MQFTFSKDCTRIQRISSDLSPLHQLRCPIKTTIDSPSHCCIINTMPDGNRSYKCLHMLVLERFFGLNGMPLACRCEFCRQNGLDPGNVSRLERGLLPAPRSSEILHAYAEALKLDPKSDDWRTFQALAVQESLPKGFQTIRREARRVEPWVNAADIEAWADRISARSDFPRLIRRLIHATSEAALRIEFPAGEGSQRPGWDGIVNASAPTANVPAGLSTWELGVGADPARKAESDLRSRTKNPLGIEPSEATFVFVTARRWPGKAKWEAEKKQTRNLERDSRP